MPHVQYEIAPISDRAALDAFAEVFTSLGIDDGNFEVEVMPDVPGLSSPLADYRKSKMYDLASADADLPVWRNLHLRSVNGKPTRHLRISREDQGGVVRAIVTFDQQPRDAGEASKFLAATWKHLRRFNTPAVLRQVLEPSVAEFASQREAGLVRLEELAQRIIEGAAEQRRRLDDEFQRRQDAAQAVAEQEEANRRKLHAEKLAEVQQQREALNEEKARLDSRSAEQVRRSNVQGLNSVISARAKEFTLTATTIGKRRPIHAIFVALLLVSGGLIAHGLLVAPEPTQNLAVDWIRALRVPLGAGAFGLSAVFYIRWNDAWARQHADEEFRLKAMELDIHRASWVTELALQFMSEKGEIPDGLLERLSVGLFERQHSPAVRHPSQDALAALLGESNRLKIDLPNGIGAEVSRRGIRRAGQSLRRDEN